MKKSLLLVFCKNPVLGKVKTRLAQSIGKQQALLIYKALLDKTASVLAKLKIDVHIYYSDKIEEKDIFDEIVIQKKCQIRGTLGEKMLSAFQESFTTHDKIVIIGTDLWTLEEHDIESAFMALDKHPTVIGPSSDGGYYLLGLTKLVPQIFINKEWGTASVLSKTLTDLKATNYHLLQEKNDIDTYLDLEENPTLKAKLK